MRTTLMYATLRYDNRSEKRTGNPRPGAECWDIFCYRCFRVHHCRTAPTVLAPSITELGLHVPPPQKTTTTHTTTTNNNKQVRLHRSCGRPMLVHGGRTPTSGARSACPTVWYSPPPACGHTEGTGNCLGEETAVEAQRKSTVSQLYQRRNGSRSTTQKHCLIVLQRCPRRSPECGGAHG